MDEQRLKLSWQYRNVHEAKKNSCELAIERTGKSFKQAFKRRLNKVHVQKQTSTRQIQ